MDDFEKDENWKRGKNHLARILREDPALFAELEKMGERQYQTRLLRKRPGGLEKWVGREVKKGYPCDPGQYPGREHMWLTVLSVTTGGRLRCELKSTPFHCTSYLERGEIVEIDEAEIEEVWPEEQREEAQGDQETA
jgi:hypothetical protein